MKPVNLEELSEEAQKLAVKALRLKQTNAELASDIERFGGGVEVSMAALEHFQQSLVNLGVITPEQLWALKLDWELNLKEQLVAIRNRLQAERQQAQISTPQRPRLIIPGR